MQTQIQVFEYEGQMVEFDLSRSGVMVNATAMAKIFSSKMNHYLENEDTKKFIDALVQDRNSGLESPVSTEADFIKKVHGGRGNGTWMDRVLALHFASWLNPQFAVWVFKTIDKLLLGELRHYRARLPEMAAKQRRRAELEKKFKNDLTYQEWRQLEKECQAYVNEPKNSAQKELDLFGGGANTTNN